MAEVLLPPWIVPEEETQEWLDEGSSVFGAAFAPGIAQRQSYGGLRLKLSRRHTVRGEEKAQLLAILNQTRGRYNVLRTKVHFALRGAMPTTQHSPNNVMDGTTSWTSGSAAHMTVSATDRLLRASRLSTASSTTLRNGSFTASAYMPYAYRVNFTGGKGINTAHGPRFGSTAGAGDLVSTVNLGGVVGLSNTTATGLVTASGVLPAGTTFPNVLISASGAVAGDYAEFNYASTTQVMQVDNGLNSLLQSDEFDTTWAVTRSSIDDQTAGTTAPDGTSTADALHEDATAASTHYVEQTGVVVASAAGDYAFACALKAANRDWGSLSILEGIGSTELGADFDLANGVVGTTRAGANWTNVRSFIEPMGDGWFYCRVVGRKTNASTVLTARVWVGEADNDRTFTGLNQDSIYLWRGTLVQSGVPTRLIQTTTTVSTGTSQTGNALHVKGLPASTNGLLLPGDYFEINGEIKQCTAPLNSDAAGLGYLQFEPALVRSPANDDPVIVTDPMGKFLVSNIKIENEFGTQAVVTYDLEHIYE
jgi:hypothetical protein